ncbi:protein O-mannosyl-transferase 2-like [Penaeus indicus]|uniref:protein O-mannosyl-transferase 2-like n=1 Tax=Penaeus indicus TaxID=29960 RepID=UPI00300DADB2
MRYDNFPDHSAALPEVTSTWSYHRRSSRRGAEEINDESAVSSEGEKEFLKVKKRKHKKIRATSQENHHWWYAFAVVTLLAVATRQVGLDLPAGTVWDEVHFGTFANHYINRTFYHDVHPPLGKMMVAGAAWLTGYQATFEFAVGKDYTPDINFVGMRGVSL